MNKAGFSKSVLHRRGFTVVELLVGLLVTSIVLGAAANLSYAVGRAIESTEKLNHSQRTLRYATLRIGELIRHGKLVISNPGISGSTMINGLAIWTADKNLDGQINGSELVYIRSEPDMMMGEYVRMLDFPGETQVVTLGEIMDGSARITLITTADERYTVLIDDVTAAFFYVDGQTTKFVAETGKYVVMDFALNIDSVRTPFQIRARTGASADNLIDKQDPADQQTWELVGDDD